MGPRTMPAASEAAPTPSMMRNEVSPSARTTTSGWASWKLPIARITARSLPWQ